MCTSRRLDRKIKQFSSVGLKGKNLELAILIYLDGRKASFFISLSYLPLSQLSPPADLVTRLQLRSYQLCDTILQVGLAEGRSRWDERPN